MILPKKHLFDSEKRKKKTNRGDSRMTYLRSSMSQERLNDLAILCIEKNILENINVDTIINDFASKNARRQCFL